MNIIDLATKAMQTAINTAVDGVRTVVDTIKTTIDATKTKVDTINTNVSTVNTNVGAVKTTVEATKVVVDSTKTNIDTLLAGRVVKSVQRGTINGDGASNGNRNVVISSVNPNKCHVSLYGHVGVNGVLPFVTNLTATSLTITNGAGTWSSNVIVSWEVVEYY